MIRLSRFSHFAAIAHTGRLLSIAAAMGATLFASTAYCQTLAGGMLIEYQSFPSELETDQPSPSIQVYADGRVIAVYPNYMQHSGARTGQLNSNEIAQLVAEIAAAGVATLDMAQLKQDASAARSANRTNGMVFFAAGDAMTKFKLPTANGMKTMQWQGLRNDARRIDLPGVQALAALEQRLLALAKNLQPGGLQ